MSLDTYRIALAMNLSDQIRAMLQDQFAQIQQARDRIATLRDSTAPPAQVEDEVRRAR